MVYPAALLFKLITKSTDGLILYLRSIYVAGAVLAAFCTGALFRQIGTRLLGWLAAALVLVFIPYGLPAPSYNTISEQMAIVALTSFGCAVLASAEGRKYRAWLAISAVAWAFATVAYPSLIFVVGLLLASLPTIVRPPFREQLAYCGLVVGFQIVAWGCVIGILTWPRIMESIDYQSSVSPMLNVGQKLSLIAGSLTQNVIFMVATATAVVLGLARQFLPQAFAAVALSALFLLPLFAPPTLFVQSHDAIFIAALSGFGVLAWLRHDALCDRLLATLFAVSLAAGVVTAATATYAFSFPIGGALAGIVAALSEYFYPRRGEWWALPVVTLLGVILWGSASLYYGERPGEMIEPRERVTNGPYAGLAASAHTARLLSTIRAMLDERTGADDTVAVVSRLSGLYLLTKARPRVFMPFPITALAQPKALIANDLYYSAAANRPTIVIAYPDAYFEPVNPFGSNFEAWYKKVDQERTPTGTLLIFRRRD